MPRENKQRGRRGEKKRRLEEDSKEFPWKRRKSVSQDGEDEHAGGKIFIQGDAGDDFIGFSIQSEETDAPFLGLLSQEDQDYYTNVDSTLTLNEFDSDDDRSTFIDAVYRESSGKELRIASSQSSSRCLERLIMLSNAEQL